jgi:DNA-binding MarR family transcriptional regulator
MRTADDPGRDDLRRIRDFIELVGDAARSPRHRERMLRAAGTPLTGAGLLALRVVARRPGVTVSELARALDIDQSTISRQLHPLESQNLLTRAVDAKDRRVARLRVTATGRRALAALGETALYDIDIDIALAEFRPEDRRTLADLLDRFRAGMLAARIDERGRVVRPDQQAPLVGEGRLDR